MVEMFIPNWFLQCLSDAALLSLVVEIRSVEGVYVKVDCETAKMWRKSIVARTGR